MILPINIHTIPLFRLVGNTIVGIGNVLNQDAILVSAPSGDGSILAPTLCDAETHYTPPVEEAEK